MPQHVTQRGNNRQARYRYIELNPVRAAMVIAPEDYRWSSFRINALGETDPLITPHEQWSELGNNDEGREKRFNWIRPQ